MSNSARWSILNRALISVLLLYSVLLCAISFHVFFTAVHEGSPLNFASITVQVLTTLFPVLLIFGIWRPRFSSAVLFAAAAVILALTVSNAHAAASEAAGLVGASLLFLGVPTLAAAIFFHVISRPANSARP